MATKDNLCRQITKSMPSDTDCTVFITMIIMLSSNEFKLDEIQTCLSTKNIINNKKKQLLNSQAEKEAFIKFIYIKKQIFKEIIEVVDKFEKRIDNNIDESELKGIITKYYNKNKLKSWAFVKFPECLFIYLFKYDSYSYNEVFLSSNSTQITETKINELYETIVREETEKAAAAERAAEQARQDQEAAERAAAAAAAERLDKKQKLENFITNEIIQNETLTRSRLYDIIEKIMEKINSNGIIFNDDEIANKIFSDIFDKKVKINLYTVSKDNNDDEKVKAEIKKFIELFTNCKIIMDIAGKRFLESKQQMTIKNLDEIINRYLTIMSDKTGEEVALKINECIVNLGIGTTSLLKNLNAPNKTSNDLMFFINKLIKIKKKPSKSVEKKIITDPIPESKPETGKGSAESTLDPATAKISGIPDEPVEPTIISSSDTELGLDISSATSEAKPPTVVPTPTQSTKSYNIKITKDNLTGKFTTEIVSGTSDNIDNASSITKYYTISSELFYVI